MAKVRISTNTTNVQLGMLLAFRQLREAELEQFETLLVGNRSPEDIQRLANRDVGRWAERMVELHSVIGVARRLPALPLLALLDADRLRRKRASKRRQIDAAVVRRRSAF